MPRAKSKIFELLKFFQTVDLETAEEVLNACRETVRERKPKKGDGRSKPRRKIKSAPAPLSGEATPADLSGVSHV